MKFNSLFATLPLLLSINQATAQADDEIIFALEQQIYYMPEPVATEEKIQSITLPNGISLEYGEQGNANGIPVILLHGITDSRRSYDLVLPHLPANIHAYAITQRGHGHSTHPATGYHTRDFAADIAAFMRLKKIPQAIIVGHSMGSAVAQQFFYDYPQLVKGLVLVGACANYQKPELAEFAKSIKQLKDPVDKAFAEEFQKSTITRPIPSAYYEIVVQESMKVPVRVWDQAMSQIASINFMPLLEKIDIPTLVIWGDKDQYFLRADQEALLNGIAGAKLLVYEGTGHAVHWEEPVRFAKDITEFVSRF